MGKGGGTTQSTGTTYTTNIPEYAEPYVHAMLGATQKQLFDMNDQGEITNFKPYKPYSTDPSAYVAPFSPMQEQAMRTAASPEVFGQQVQGYMSPYMQNVVDVQKREAMRNAGILSAQQQARATGAGAFGGYREGIQRSEDRRNLMRQMDDIQAMGSQRAFEQGTQQARMAQGLQMQYGGMQQAQEQQKINQAIQDFANAQQYPLMQLGVMSNMLRGLPMQAATTNQYVAAPNPITQGIGLAGAGASIYNAMRPAGGAAGGLPSEFRYAEGGIASVPRYDVGGEVYSDLLDMNVDQLRNIIRESSSQRVKEMAKGILAEKAAQRMYGGGIVAFQSGGDAVDPESEASVIQRPFTPRIGQNLPRRRADFFAPPNEISDEENAAAEANFRFDQQMRAEERLRAKNAYDRLMAAERAKTPDQIAAEQQGRIKQEETDRANFVESIRQQYGDEAAKEASATGAYTPRLAAPSDSVQTRSLAPAAAPAGIMEAAQPAPAAVPAAAPAAITAVPPRAAAQPAPAAALTGRTSTAEGPVGETDAQEAARGAGTAPVVTEPTFTGTLAEAQQAAYRAQKRADRPVSAFLEEVETGKPEDKSVAEYRKQVMAERANAKDEAERQRHMRLAQFFAKWGSTPGPTIAAGLNALEKTIPDLISDEKEQKKARRELDKIMYDIDNSIRLEKLGDMKEARALKEKAADRAMSLQERLMQVQQSEEASKRNLEGTKFSANAQVRAAEIRAKDEAANRAQRSGEIADAKKFSQYQTASEQERRTLERIAFEENGDQHKADLKTAALRNEKGEIPAGMEKKVAEAQGRISERQKGWTARAQAARNNTDMAYGRLGLQTSGSPAGAGAAASSAPTADRVAGAAASLGLTNAPPPSGGTAPPSGAAAPSPGAAAPKPQPAASDAANLPNAARVELARQELAQAQQFLVAATNSKDAKAIERYAADVARLQQKLNALTR